MGTPDTATLPDAAVRPDAPAAADARAAHAPGAGRRRVWGLWAAGLRWIVAALLPLALLGWLAATESGLRAVAAATTGLSGGQLQIQGIRGTLLRGWQLDHVRWHSTASDPGPDLQLEHLRLAWAPRALLQGRLHITHLQASQLHVVAPAGRAPAAPPVSLHLPVALQLDELRLQQVTWRAAQADAQPTPVARDLHASARSDGHTHRLQVHSGRTGALALSGQATLAGTAPFALSADGRLSGQALEQPFHLDWRAQGVLTRLDLTAQVHSAARPGAAGTPAPQGSFSARLQPFAARMLVALQARLTAINPAQWWPGLPQAQLDLEAQLDGPVALDDQAAPNGRLQLYNRRAGTLNQGQLPVLSAQSRLAWHAGALRLDALDLSLTGNAHVRGQAQWQDNTLTLNLLASDVNARALDARLLSTRLSGPLQAQLGMTRQHVDTELHEPNRRLRLLAERTADTLRVMQLELADGDARLLASGQLSRNAHQSVRAQGELQQFDPGRYVPALGLGSSRINARFDLTGALLPEAALGLDFEITRSRLGPQALEGKGTLQLRGTTLGPSQIELRAGPNRLALQGAWGQAGDALRVVLAAPDLASLGWRAVSGRAEADLALSGTWAQPRLQGSARAEALRLADWAELQALTLKAERAGDTPTWTGDLACTRCAVPALQLPLLDLSARWQGSAATHQVALHASRPGLGAFQAQLAGRLEDAGWQGTLEQWVLSGPAPAGETLLRLRAPMPLRASRTDGQMGPAELEGPLGRLHLEQLAWGPEHWRSTGQMQQVQVHPLLALWPAAGRWVEALASPRAPLQLAGRWQLAHDGTRPAAALQGQIQLSRTAGDLVLDGQALGLSQLQMDLNAEGGRARLTGQAQGARLGQAQGTLEAQLAHNGAPATDAPLAGTLSADMPDLSWLGPLLGSDWRLGGHARGALQLAGTPNQPQWTGSLQGEALSLRAVDLGLHLAHGSARLELLPERLVLHALDLQSLWAGTPAALLAREDAALRELTRTPGRVSAAGELRLRSTTSSRPGDTAGAEAAQLSVRLDRVGLLQQGDRWASVSGDSRVSLDARTLAVTGRLTLDAGYLGLAGRDRPTLGDDVIVTRTAQPAHATRIPVPAGGGSATLPRLRLDATVGLGERFHFEGAGISTRLTGQLQLRSAEGERAPRVTGTIRAEDGRVEAYGQRLEIERGLLNFQGPMDNPGLNVRAVRRNLRVEPGIEITGTVQRPQIQLVSSPPLPDAEKLSWLILGRAPTEGYRGDADLLVAAANTLFGNQADGPVRALRRSLGIDELGLSSGRLDSTGAMPRSRVVGLQGLGGDDGSADNRIVTLGKRLSGNVLLSYEKALASSEHIVKLTLDLGRQLSVVLRAGTESAIDLTWRRSFGAPASVPGSD